MTSLWHDRIRPHVTRVSAYADENWKWLTFLAWVGIAAFYIVARWQQVHWMVLSDTDDNIRYVQVKDWLAGQGWFDLSQHRLDPPVGANIHWSRLVDLPIAGLMLFFRFFTDTGTADRLACAIAPLLPLLPMMLGLAFIVRRLAGGNAWIVAILAPLAAQMGLSMYMPMRIDHHGWQLALTVAMLAGMVDRNWLRGGIVAGLSSALSIAIGMEMIVYLAAAGAIVALRWVFKDGAARRMRPYALSLGGGTGLLFVTTASYANRAPVCDALSPVWVAILGAASGGMLLLTLLPLKSWPQRLAAGALVGLAVGLFAWVNWPQCLSGAYQLSPELQKLWLANIREAKPITAQARSVVIPLLALPVTAVIGALIACWQVRRDTEALWAWATVTLMTLFAVALLFWQLRAGPAAQFLAIPAAAWATWTAGRALVLGRPVWRLVGGVAILLVVAVLFSYQLYPKANRLIADITGAKPAPPPRPFIAKRTAAIRKANGQCRSAPALKVLDQLPSSTIFTLVDLGPRLIATTHHRAIAGPYHRNGDAILAIHHAMDGPPEGFRAIAARHFARYLLVCPNFPEATVYQARSPRGFYAQLMRGKVPAWLTLVNLNVGYTWPYRIYRIDYAAPDDLATGSEKAAQ
ncbi:hypothetical protein [Sphingobium algorifonticola]|uniref:AcrB/AcrD/AcrF family protein n=1 Tax=Sphingobium algorifonticola TaxID=2008318 RepID=A0A437JB07_9SPHN|nr:hypothetical protein [Sphingobium algorifonticola]RVT42452.1 hypothetical protein ENE74_08045 [Sphingobium algorifonticola]